MRPVSPSKEFGQRVVARLRDGRVIKGFMQRPPLLDLDRIEGGDSSPLPEEIVLFTEQNHGSSVTIKRDELKALFFVKSFAGQKEYREIKFFDRNPTIKGLWVQVKFYDRETLEGIVPNSLHFIVEPAFALKPPDPQSNNDVLFVVKNSLTDFRVLGVRMHY